MLGGGSSWHTAKQGERHRPAVVDDSKLKSAAQQVGTPTTRPAALTAPIAAGSGASGPLRMQGGQQQRCPHASSTCSTHYRLGSAAWGPTAARRALMQQVSALGRAAASSSRAARRRAVLLPDAASLLSPARTHAQQLALPHPAARRGAVILCASERRRRRNPQAEVGAQLLHGSRLPNTPWRRILLRLRHATSPAVLERLYQEHRHKTSVWRPVHSAGILMRVAALQYYRRA